MVRTAQTTVSVNSGEEADDDDSGNGVETKLADGKGTDNIGKQRVLAVKLKEMEFWRSVYLGNREERITAISEGVIIGSHGMGAKMTGVILPLKGELWIC